MSSLDLQQKIAKVERKIDETEEKINKAEADGILLSTTTEYLI